MSVLRWIFFIPGALIVGTLASIAGSWGSSWFPFFIQEIICGLMGSIATFITGMGIAPKKNGFVKWTMIVVCACIGVLEILGSMASSDDGGKGYVIGASVLFTTMTFCSLSVDQLAKDYES